MRVSGGSLRRDLLLSTTVLVGALTGYGSRAYAACANSGGSTYECSGSNTTTQTISANNAAVSTVAGFSVDTTGTGGGAITITGDGALSYTDVNFSPLTAAGGSNPAALSIRPSGDDGATLGSIAVDTNGTLIGESFGILAFNRYGRGEVSIVTRGDVTGSSVGIVARTAQADGTDMSITTANGTTVIGGSIGIYAQHTKSCIAPGGPCGVPWTPGALTITTNGDVNGGVTGDGIRAWASGTDLTINTGTNTTVTSGFNGIYARHGGSGPLTVTANGDVNGTTGFGIQARSSSPGDLSITTGAGTTVTGGKYAISAISFSDARRLTVTTNGDVTSTNGVGIYARHRYSGPISITIGSNSNVFTSTGLGVHVYSAGTNTITNRGTITSLSGTAIRSTCGLSYDPAFPTLDPKIRCGDETVDNSGTITGSVDLIGGNNAFNNLVGGVFNAGTSVILGAGNNLTNFGTLSPGGPDTIQTTLLVGNLIQRNGSVREST